MIGVKPDFMNKSIFFLFAFLFSIDIQAQQTQQSGWFYWLSSFKIHGKLGAHFDLQLRSADNWEQIQTVIIRPGITYHFNSRQNATLGYANINTFLQTEGASDNRLTENRIWEQFIQAHKIKNIFVSHRFRVEQRFIERFGNNDLFSQRLRYFTRFVLPLNKQQKVFNQGPYAALQNELFLHLQNKNELNNSTFDQNRALGAVGIRLHPKVDLEIGYLNQFIKGRAANINNHVFQFGILSRL